MPLNSNKQANEVIVNMDEYLKYNSTAKTFWVKQDKEPILHCMSASGRTIAILKIKHRD